MKKFSWHNVPDKLNGGYQVVEEECFCIYFKPCRKGGHTHNHIINKLKHNMLDKGTARQRKILHGVFGVVRK